VNRLIIDLIAHPQQTQLLKNLKYRPQWFVKNDLDSHTPLY